METHQIVINFSSHENVEETAYQVILDTINKQFAAARGNLEKMEALNALSKELRYATEKAMDELRHGPVPKKVQILA